MSSTVGCGGYVPTISFIGTTDTKGIGGSVLVYAGGGVFGVSGRSNTEPSRAGGGFSNIDLGILKGSARTDSRLT
jgi:hypothetical protein